MGGFNLSLILRKLLGAGTPRELKNRAGQVFLRLLRILLEPGKAIWRIPLPSTLLASRQDHRHIAADRHHPRFLITSATGC
jgi:hypothetical protein